MPRATWTDLQIPGLMKSVGVSEVVLRGTFMEVFSIGEVHDDAFAARQIFWSRSQEGVIRELHFQLPPDGTSKRVLVVSGEVRDLVLDLRRGSPAVGLLLDMPMGPFEGSRVVLPGRRHGFGAFVPDTLVYYLQNKRLAKQELYGGIRFDSVGIAPSFAKPGLSTRDQGWPRPEEFDSPFLFDE